MPAASSTMLEVDRLFCFQVFFHIVPCLCILRAIHSTLLGFNLRFSKREVFVIFVPSRSQLWLQQRMITDIEANVLINNGLGRVTALVFPYYMRY